jgi:hypothetical protein
MAELWAYLPAADAAAVKAALDARAYETIHGAGGDSRTADQRRADALVELASAALADPHLAKAHGQRPGVQVTVAASTLMGLDDQPGELDGYGPITAAMARRIAFDPTARWRRLLTDDHGLIQAVATKTYRPPLDVTRTVIARDVHCTFPGCRKKAVYTDIDHVRAYRKGDRTTQANLMSLCRRHHRLKHSGRWRVHRDDITGVTTWTDRRGRRYRSRPPTQPTTTADTNPPATVGTPPSAGAQDDSPTVDRSVPPSDNGVDPPPF